MAIFKNDKEICKEKRHFESIFSQKTEKTNIFSKFLAKMLIYFKIFWYF